MRDYPALHLDTEYERLSSITLGHRTKKDYPALHLDTELRKGTILLLLFYISVSSLQ